MNFRRLGRTGLKVSELCIGAMTFGESDGFMKGVAADERNSHRMLDISFDRGINFIDTANVYGNGLSEEIVGRWLQKRIRDQVVLATKCAMPMGSGPNERGTSAKNVLSSIEGSLRRLKVDYIDLYQIHMQDISVPIEETLRALDTLVRDGKVRYVGCSNYAAYRMVEALWASDVNGWSRFETLQAQYSLIVRDVERELVPACREFELGLLVWSPLGRGFLTGKYRRATEPTEGRLKVWTDTAKAIITDRNFDVVDAVEQVARDRNASVPQVALAWLLRQPSVASVIVGARTPEQLEDNLNSIELTLTDANLHALDDASKITMGYPYDFIRRFHPGW